MPVGTLGSVKSLTPEELVAVGAQIILGNTYHLYLRPGSEVIRRFERAAPLHELAPAHPDRQRRVPGVLPGQARQDHVRGGRPSSPTSTGRSHHLTPEKAIEIQRVARLGHHDVPGPVHGLPGRAARRWQRAAEITFDWARRCRDGLEAAGDVPKALFGIVQGGMFKDLRELSAERLGELGFSGYALGGLSVGEPQDRMLEMADFTLPLLPADKPKYVMGVGTPEDLIELVCLGADMFDCVLPTRNARNGQLFTRHGTDHHHPCLLPRGHRPAGPRLRLLHLPQLLAGLSAPPVAVARTLGLPIEHDPQRAFLRGLPPPDPRGHPGGQFEGFKKRFYETREI